MKDKAHEKKLRQSFNEWLETMHTEMLNMTRNDTLFEAYKQGHFTGIEECKEEIDYLWHKEE